MTVATRDILSADLPALLALNNAAVPGVNELDAAALASLVAASHRAIAVVDDAAPDVPLGFVLALLPGLDYASENYRWFSARSSDFLYVDRIAVDVDARDRGLGQALYAEVFRAAHAAGVSEVFCEVNLDPPNPGSLRFHGRLGFVEVGQLSTKGGEYLVSLMAAPVAAR